MTIHLDTEIVATRFDPVTLSCSYTIERGGKRWTVEIPKAHFDKHGANKIAKRTHLATVLNNAMLGPHDEEIRS